MLLVYMHSLPLQNFSKLFEFKKKVKAHFMAKFSILERGFITNKSKK